MSASEYPGAEQDAQRLIDQFDALVLDGGRRPQDVDASTTLDHRDRGAQDAVARLSAALLAGPTRNDPNETALRRAALRRRRDPLGTSGFAPTIARDASVGGVATMGSGADERNAASVSRGARDNLGWYDNRDDQYGRVERDEREGDREGRKGISRADPYAGNMDDDDVGFGTIDDLDRVFGESTIDDDDNGDRTTNTARRSSPAMLFDVDVRDDSINAINAIDDIDGRGGDDRDGDDSDYGSDDDATGTDEDYDGSVNEGMDVDGDCGERGARLDRTRYAGIEYRDIDWGDGLPTALPRSSRDGRPPLVRPSAIDSTADLTPRVIRVARGVVDDGETVLAIDEWRLAPGGTAAYTNLNGEAYATADLLAYLYAEEPADKSVPHTRQRLSQAQINSLLALMAAGHTHLLAPGDVDSAAYALSRPLASPTDTLSHEAAATVDAHLETALVDEERAVDLGAYHVAALTHYAVEIAMAIGWDYKPAINFAIARYINAAGTPLLAEEGGLLPDEIPRRHEPHRRNARANIDQLSNNRQRTATDALAHADQCHRSMDTDRSLCGNGDHLRDDWSAGSNAEDDAVAIPAETRDEAVARHRALADRRRRHPPMGMDLELVAAVLQAEADDGGLVRSPANLDEMRRRLRAAIGARLKPSKADRKIDRYAVPWAYGVCCALDRRDVEEVLSSPAGAAVVAERVNRAWVAETTGPEALDADLIPLDASTVQCPANNAPRPLAHKPPRPLAPYLSDDEFARRLARLEPCLLAALSRVIPLEARGRSDLDAGDYIIYESNLALGAPLSPPMGHSLAQKVMRFARQAGTTPRACDLAPKPPAIVFVRDCPQPAPAAQAQ